MRISDWSSDVCSSDLHQVTGVFPVRLAELPETAAQRVQAGGGHVDRAKTTVRSVIDRAELLRPPAGQCLALVAAEIGRASCRESVVSTCRSRCAPSP